MAKCADCGFLAVRNYHSATARIEEVSTLYREPELEQQYTFADQKYKVPVCLFGKQELQEGLVPQADQTDIKYMAAHGVATHFEFKRILAAIHRQHQCSDHSTFYPSRSPQEHVEMWDKEHMLKWQAEREDADRKWRDEQRRIDLQARRDEANDRRREIIILTIGILASILIGLLTVWAQSRSTTTVVNRLELPIQQSVPSTGATPP